VNLAGLWYRYKCSRTFRQLAESWALIYGSVSGYCSVQVSLVWRNQPDDGYAMFCELECPADHTSRLLRTLDRMTGSLESFVDALMCNKTMSLYLIVTHRLTQDIGPYSDLMMRFSVVCTLCAHSVQLPS
jgi:hypothetical protein